MESPADQPTDGTSQFKKFGLYVLLPAFIAGFFAIAPKLYEELTKPRADLNYTVVAGPSFNFGTENQRIFSLTIQNSGRVVLSNIDTEISPTVGKVDRISVEKNLLSPIVRQNTDAYNVNIPKLLVGEKVSISILGTTSSGTPDIEVASRSNEVVGNRLNIGAGDNSSNFSFLGPILSGLSVAVMAILFSKRSRFRLFDTDWTPNDRQENIRLIVALSQISYLSECVRHYPDITYATLADEIYIRSTSAKDQADEFILCLRAILICETSTRSANIVRFYLSRLGFQMTDGEYDNLKHASGTLSARQRREQILDLLSTRNSVAMGISDTD